MNEKIAYIKRNFPEIAQSIFEETYLLPFKIDKNNPKKNLYALPVERISHGAMHASRVAAYLPILVNFFKELGLPKEIFSVSGDDLTLLQIAALFHDCARQDDKQKDKWEKESAEKCRKFLEDYHIDHETAVRFSSYIHTHGSDLFSMLLQTADALDIMRCKEKLLLEKVSLFNILKTDEDKNKFVDLVWQIRKLISIQHDMKFDCAVTLKNEVILPGRPKTRNSSKPELKQSYEQAKNCYLKVTNDFESFSLLNISNTLEPKNSLSKEQVSNKLVLPANCQLYYTFDNKAYYLCFAEEDEAKKTLRSIHHILQGQNGIDKACINKFHKNSPTPYRFRLTFDQWEALREYTRASAEDLSPKGKFLIKSIRGDIFNYFRRFIEMVSFSFKKHPLRKGLIKQFTVTGKGIFKRKGFTEDDDNEIPLKEPQYTEEEKQNYSNFQSTSLATSSFHPRVFGFDKRGTKLVGVLFEEKDTLFSDRLFIYDGGTVDRPYDFMKLKAAKNYLKSKLNTVLFSKDKLNEFITAIESPSNADKYNEVLARLRWNMDGTSKIFIASDTLEARLLAQDYARILESFLKENKLCDPNYSIPICFYLPKKPALHFKRYTHEEQKLDTLAARAIYLNDAQKLKYYSCGDYEFLLALSPQELELLFQETRDGHNFILSLLAQGYVHIVLSLLEKGGSQLKEILRAQLKNNNNTPIIAKVLYHCLRCENEELANFIFDNSSFLDLDLTIEPEFNPLLIAAEKNYHHWIGSLLESKSLNVNAKNSKNETALFLAAREGHIDVVKKLLSHKTIDVNFYTDDYGGPLHIASCRGHINIVKELFQHPKINVNLKDSKCGATPLYQSVSGGHLGTLIALLEHNEIDVNAQNIEGWTAINAASFFGDLSLVRKLLRCKKVDFNLANKIGYTPLMSAIEKSNIDVVRELLKEPTLVVDAKNSKGKSAIMLAAQKGHNDVMTELLSHQNFPSQSKKIALQLAIENRNKKMIIALLNDPETDVNIECIKGVPLLKYMVTNNLAELAQQIVVSKNYILDITKNYNLEALIAIKNAGFTDCVDSIVTNYYQNRCAQGAYKNWYGFFFGINKNKKILAAQALMGQKDTEPHKAALSTGELANIYKLWLA